MGTNELVVSVYRGVHPAPTGKETAAGIFDQIRTGQHTKAKVEAIQAAKVPMDRAAIPMERAKVAMEEAAGTPAHEGLKAEYDRAKAAYDPLREHYEGLKKSLPSLTWAGTFARRHKEALESPSGLAGMDIDGIDNAEQVREMFRDDPHVYGAFVSPSGCGVKAIYRIEQPADDADHKRIFDALAARIRERYGLEVDQSGKDISRLCFMGYDPHAWNRDDAEIFHANGSRPARVEATRNDSSCSTPQGRDKLAALAVRVEQAAAGTRNDTLNKAAYLAGGIAAAGEISQAEAEAVLTAAGRAAGLTDDEISKTVPSGLTSGQQKPITAAGLPPVSWGPLLPMPDERPAAPPFPLQALPPGTAEFVKATAEYYCVPPENVAVAALGAAGGAIGRRVGLCPVEAERYFQVGNLWVGIVAPPGAKKTDTVEEAVAPLHALEREEQQRWELDSLARLVRYEQMEAAAKDKKRPTQERAEAKEALQAMEAEQPKRWTCSDTSIEKLLDMLSRNPGGLLMVWDELYAWLTGLERTGHESDRPKYLSLWNGIGQVQVDRIGRGSAFVPGCLSLIGGIQPARLERYLSQAVDNAGDDGLMGRFSLVAWAGSSLPPYERHPDDPNAAARWDSILRGVAGMTTRMDIQRKGIPCATFAAEARPVWEKWHLHNENRVRRMSKDEPARAAAVMKHNSLVLRGALVLEALTQAERGSGHISEVSLHALKQALILAEWMEAVTKRIYAAEATPGMPGARALMDMILCGTVPDGETVRDIYRDNCRHLKTAHEVTQAALILERANAVKVQKTGKSSILRINPALTAAHNG